MLEQLLANVEEDKYLIEDWDTQGQVCARLFFCPGLLVLSWWSLASFATFFICLGQVVRNERVSRSALFSFLSPVKQFRVDSHVIDMFWSLKCARWQST